MESGPEPGDPLVHSSTTRCRRREELQAGQQAWRAWRYLVWTAQRLCSSSRHEYLGRCRFVPSGGLDCRLRHETDSHALYFSKTVSPSTTVRSTVACPISPGSQAVMSRSTTTKSAAMPGARRPFQISVRVAKALMRVYNRIAVSADTRCSVPSTCPEAVCRSTAAWTPIRGFPGVTGRSELKAALTPASRNHATGELSAARSAPIAGG